MLDSCELNKVGQKFWSPMTSLPGYRFGLRGLSVGSHVLMMGNIRLVHTDINIIIQEVTMGGHYLTKMRSTLLISTQKGGRW